MQEAAKVNYVQYGKSTKNKKGKKSVQSGASGGNYKGDRGHGTSSKPGGKGKKFPFLQDTCYRERQTSENSGLQSFRHSVQRLWKEGAL